MSPIYIHQATPRVNHLRLITVSHNLGSNSLEKVHIRKLAHLIHVVRLHNLLVVEEHPGGRAFQLLADKGNVVARYLLADNLDRSSQINLPCVNARSLVADN